MALTPLQQVRIEIQDTAGAGLYILQDDEIQYFLDKNNNNVTRASIDCARAVLFKLSMQGDERVDILSLSGSKSASEYRQALQLFLRDPVLNPLTKNITGYAGNISKSDMEANNANPDNNYVRRIEDSSTDSGNPDAYF